MGFFTNLLDPVLNPLLALGPIWAILIISLVVSLIITLVYKFATNQEKMKELKLEMKTSQKKMKELKNEPEKLMAMQKESMKKNMEYMKHSFKATLITFIPVIIIFGWMQTNLAYEPIRPGDDFSVKILFEKGLKGEVEIVAPEEIEILGGEKQEIDGEMEWELRALEGGGYFIDFKHEGQVVSKEVIVSEKLEYAEPTKEYENFGTIGINYNKLVPLGKISVFGWQPGWLALYIVFSIVFSMALRKVFRLY